MTSFLSSAIVRAAALLICLNAGSRLLAATPAAPDAIHATGIEAGACAAIGIGDPETLIALANGGRMLVHALHPDPAVVQTVRKVLMERGVQGLVSIRIGHGGPVLPYARNLLNLVVADLDGLKAPPADAEILRVLAYGGAARMGQGGAWRTLTKPRATGLADWTHLNRGVTGNPVSPDTVLEPTTGLQWIADAQARADNALVHPRVWQGLWACENHLSDSVVVRDAANGVALLTIPTGPPRKGANYIAKPFVVADGEVFCHPDESALLAAFNARTGDKRITYDGGFALATANANNLSNVRPGHISLLVLSNLVVQAQGHELRVLDRASGAVRWSFKDAGHLYLPAALTGQDALVVARVAAAPAFNRQFPGKVVHLHRLSLKDGATQWSVPVTPPIACEAIGWRDGVLALVAGETGGKATPASLMGVDPANGKELWRVTWTANEAPPGLSGEINGYMGIGGITRDAVVFAAYDYVMRLDPRTGKLIDFQKMRGGWHSACQRSLLADHLAILRTGAFIDLAQPGRAIWSNFTRSSCGSGGVIGNGTLFYGPNRCMCGDYVRGYLACASEPVPLPVDDATRLERGPSQPPVRPVPAVWPAKDEWPLLLGTPGRTAAAGPGPTNPVLRLAWSANAAGASGPADGPVRQDWRATDQWNGPVTAPTVADGRVVVAERDAHVVRAFDAATGTPQWTFIADARVDSPPTLYRGLVLFGCRDGRIYALDSATGGLVWRFLAAPHPRWIGAYSQLESAHPVFGTVMVAANGVIAIAGRSSQADGGLLAWRLDPLTGAIQAKQALDGKPAWGPLITKRTQARPEFVRANNPLVADDRLVATHNVTFDQRSLAVVGGLPTEKSLSAVSIGGNALKGPHLDTRGGYAPHLDWTRSQWGGPGHRNQPRLLALGMAAVGDVLAADARHLVAAQTLKNKATVRCWKAGQQVRESVPYEFSGDKPVWEVSLPLAAGAGGPAAIALAGDHVLVGWRAPGRHRLQVLDARDGKEVASVVVPSAPILNGLAVAGGRVYLTLGDGTLVCCAP